MVVLVVGGNKESEVYRVENWMAGEMTSRESRVGLAVSTGCVEDIKFVVGMWPGGMLHQEVERAVLDPKSNFGNLNC